MARGNWLQALMRLEIWLMVGVISLLVVVFLRSMESTFDAVGKFKPEQIKAAMAGSLRDVHVAWLAKGRPVGVGSEIVLGGQLLRLNVEGWPIAVGAGPQVVQVTDVACSQLFAALLADNVPGELPLQPLTAPDSRVESNPGVVKAAHFSVNALAVGPVCVYQIGDEEQDRFSLLYNTDSGEVRTAFHSRAATP